MLCVFNEIRCHVVRFNVLCRAYTDVFWERSVTDNRVVTGEKNCPTAALACRKTRLELVPGAWGYCWDTLSPRVINMVEWPFRFGGWVTGGQLVTVKS
jgi:hypothetical protein